MRPPVALSIAGTDPSGGAGIHADLKTFTALGAYGTTVITALVAQNTHGVSRVYPIDEDFVADQLVAVLDDMAVDSVKTGMLGSRPLVELVASELGRRDFGLVVVDPVMISTSGHRLLAADAIGAVRQKLLPAADLITPNIPEAALLLGDDVGAAATVPAMREQARELVTRGPAAVLLTGGHLDDGDPVDVLAVRRGDDVETVEFAHPRIATANTHGTGCTLSAAITAEYAVRSRDAPERDRHELVTAAVTAAVGFLARALAGAARWQLSLDPAGAHGPVNHLIDIRRKEQS